MSPFTAPTLSVCALAMLMSLSSPTSAADVPQGSDLTQIKKVFVGSLGDKPGAATLQRKLAAVLAQKHFVEVVGDPAEADAIVTGSGEIWLEGYISTNPKLSPWNRQPVYDGYLSVELRSKDGQLLWSCLAKPGKFRWHPLAEGLANQVRKKLIAARQTKKGGNP